jgi:hypothetical protein
MWEAPVKFQRTSVGLDVHARSVVGCGLDWETGEIFQRRLIVVGLARPTEHVLRRYAVLRTSSRAARFSS